MRTRQFYVSWVLALLMVVLWARELNAPPAPATTTIAAVIPLPPFPSQNARPAATLPAAKVAGVALKTCFEREPDDYWAVRHAVFDEFALDGEFATGVAATPIILALYEPQDGKIWDYAERCNSAAYHQQVKAVRKLRTASLTKDVPDWRQGGPFGGRGGKPSGGVEPSSFGFVPLGGPPSVFSFGGGGGKGTPGGGSGGGPGNQVVDNGSGGDGDNPDDKDNPGPDNGNPTNPGGNGPGTENPTAVPEPGTLAVFLGLMAGFGVMRRRALK